MKIDIIWPYGQTIFMRNQLQIKSNIADLRTLLDD